MPNVSQPARREHGETITPLQILPHPTRGTMEIGTERIMPVFGQLRAADGASDDNPVITVQGTDGTEDRHGTPINPEGWDFKPFERNPVALWSHGTVENWPAVGTIQKIRGVGGAWDFDSLMLIKQWRHLDVNMPAFLWEVYRDFGLGAVSVSFIPKKWEDYESTGIPTFFAEGVRYLRQELTEISFVNVPSNRNALAKGMERYRGLGKGEALARMLGYELSPIILRTAKEKTMPTRTVIALAERAIRATPPFDFASTQINLPKDVADKVLALGATIPDASLAEKGRETQPHVTVKFGLDAAVTAAQVKEALANSDTAKEIVAKGSGELTLGATDCFAADGYDVVYIAVESADLIALNSAISGGVQVTNTQPDYVPHVTLAYVNSGEGEKFAGDASLAGTTVSFDTIAYSDTKGQMTDIPLADAVATRKDKPRNHAEFRAQVRAILTRCGGCDPFNDDNEPPITDEAVKAAEIQGLNDIAADCLKQIETGLRVWKAAEHDQLHSLASMQVADSMWRYDRCGDLLERWYGEELGGNVPDINLTDAATAVAGLNVSGRSLGMTRRVATVEARTAFRASVKEMLRCCGCDPCCSDEPPELSTDQSVRDVEIQILRDIADESMMQLETAMQGWKSAENDRLRQICSDRVFQAMWVFDMCTEYLEDWYGAEVVSVPSIDTAQVARALVGYDAKRAGAVFSKKNLTKIDQVIALMNELRAAAEKPTADDIPADEVAEPDAPARGASISIRGIIEDKPLLSPTIVIKTGDVTSEQATISQPIRVLAPDAAHGRAAESPEDQRPLYVKLLSN